MNSKTALSSRSDQHGIVVSVLGSRDWAQHMATFITMAWFRYVTGGIGRTCILSTSLDVLGRYAMRNQTLVLGKIRLDLPLEGRVPTWLVPGLPVFGPNQSFMP